MTNTILHIDSSARHTDSVSRDLSARIVAVHPGARVITRDLAETPLPHVTEDWVAANFTPADTRTPAQQAVLAQSDALVAELKEADTVVIGLPIYNFGPPAALKAWADLVARAGTTFQYTPTGPEGLIPNKPVYVIVASGGVPVGSPMDLSSTWLTTFLGFLGLTDVTVIAADQLNVDPEGALATAKERVDAVQLAAA